MKEEKLIRFEVLEILEMSDWKCYLFGNKPGGSGIVYYPQKGREPNIFIRWMMRICLGCTWIKGGIK